MHAIFRKINRRVMVLFLILTGAFFCVCTAILCYSAEASNHVVINEVCSNNFSSARDENGNYSDYIELYNPAMIPVSLTGFSLSDSKTETQKCLLDTVIIPAKGYYIVWADGSSGGEVGHAEFKISREGETIYLSNQKNEIIDSVEIPKLDYNTAYARKEDGADTWVRQTASNGISNNNREEILEVKGEKPVFSVKSGFYEEPFEVTITAGEGQIIYYTLDGSNPTTDSLQYQGPILIKDASLNENIYSARDDLSVQMEYIPDFKVDKATIVRAMAYNEKENTVSDIVTETYFVNFEKKEEYSGYVIASLVTDPANLFDQDFGIYGNGKAMEDVIASGEIPSYTDSNAFNSGKEWEREAVLQLFDENHRIEMQQKVGIRIAGQSTRNAVQKSFNIYAREIYDGHDILKYEFSDGMQYSSVKLRNGGTAHAESKFLDPFLQSLASERAVAAQDSNPCVVFLNGEYWGIYNIRERYKEDYFKNYYGISESNVWMLDSGMPTIGSWNAWNAYDEMVTFISENDMTVPENYAKACELLDVQSFIDFYCINLYIDNDDVAFDKNIAMWRSVQTGETEYEDCKWRFMLYDLDGAVNNPESNTFIDSEWWKEDFGLMDEPVMKSLICNEDFKQQFYETFLDIANTTFSYDRVHEELVKWNDMYAVQAVKSHQRFISEDITSEDYENYIDKIDDFFKRRPEYVFNYLEEQMEKSS